MLKLALYSVLGTGCGILTTAALLQSGYQLTPVAGLLLGAGGTIVGILRS